MQLTIQLTPQGEQALQCLQQFPAAINPALMRGLDRGLELALGRTTATRFTGKGPFPVADRRLGVVTGRLRSSLRRTPAQLSGGNIVASIGTNVVYFGAHEYGFDGTVAVKAHTRSRHVNAKGQTVAARRAKRSKVPTNVVTGQVRAHSRRVKIPERAPLRTGLQDHVGLIGQQLSASLIRAWNATP